MEFSRAITHRRLRRGSASVGRSSSVACVGTSRAPSETSGPLDGGPESGLVARAVDSAVRAPLTGGGSGGGASAALRGGASSELVGERDTRAGRLPEERSGWLGSAGSARLGPQRLTGRVDAETPIGTALQKVKVWHWSARLGWRKVSVLQRS